MSGVLAKFSAIALRASNSSQGCLYAVKFQPKFKSIDDNVLEKMVVRGDSKAILISCYDAIVSCKVIKARA
jgi:hypothetical protein